MMGSDPIRTVLSRGKSCERSLRLELHGAVPIERLKFREIGSEISLSQGLSPLVARLEGLGSRSARGASGARRASASVRQDLVGSFTEAVPNWELELVLATISHWELHGAVPNLIAAIHHRAVRQWAAFAVSKHRARRPFRAAGCFVRQCIPR